MRHKRVLIFNFLKCKNDGATSGNNSSKVKFGRRRWVHATSTCKRILREYIFFLHNMITSFIRRYCALSHLYHCDTTQIKSNHLRRTSYHRGGGVTASQPEGDLQGVLEQSVIKLNSFTEWRVVFAAKWKCNVPELNRSEQTECPPNGHLIMNCAQTL